MCNDAITKNAQKLIFRPRSDESRRPDGSNTERVEHPECLRAGAHSRSCVCVRRWPGGPPGSMPPMGMGGHPPPAMWNPYAVLPGMPGPPGMPPGPPPPVPPNYTNLAGLTIPARTRTSKRGVTQRGAGGGLCRAPLAR